MESTGRPFNLSQKERACQNFDMRYLIIVLLLLLLIISLPLQAQSAAPTLTAKDRREIAEGFAKVVETKYILTDHAKKMADAVRAQIRAGAYDNLEPASAFASAVIATARGVHHDKHMNFKVTPNPVPVETKEQKERRLAPIKANQARRANFGLAKVERLDGNVGYIDIEFFPSTRLAAPATDAAMAFVAETDALIIDARRHRGGDPETVAYLVSHFVAPGTLINTIYSRDKADPELFHAAKIPAKPYTKKVYVLTSSNTFSGGEELAYDLQSLGRAKIYGEVTGGGAHPTGGFRVHERFMASVPTHRSVNPITKTNWEGIGVKPDVVVPAADALRVAHAAAVAELAAATNDAPWRAELEKIAARLAVVKAAQDPGAPASAGAPQAALEAWIESFNKHDVAAREKWLRENTSYTPEKASEIASIDQKIRSSQGPFELVRVVRTEGLVVEVEARHTGSGMGATIEITVDEKQPKKIANVKLQPAG